MNFPPTQNFLESSVNQGEDGIVLSIVESQCIWYSTMAHIYTVIYQCEKTLEVTFRMFLTAKTGYFILAKRF